MRDAHTPLEAFLAELQLAVCVDMGASTNVLNMRDVKEAVRYAHSSRSSQSIRLTLGVTVMKGPDNTRCARHP